MKYLLITLLALPLIGCSKDEDSIPPNLDQACDPASSLVAVWEDAELDELNFRADCTGYEQNANIEFTYNKPDQGLIKVTVTNTWSPSVFVVGDEIICSIQQGTYEFEPYIYLNCQGDENYFFAP